MGVQFQVTDAELAGPLNVMIVVMQREKIIVTVSVPPAGMVSLPGLIVTPLWSAVADQERGIPLDVFVKTTVQTAFPLWSVVQLELTGFGAAVIPGICWTVRSTTTVAVFEPSLIVTLSV